MIDVLLLEKTPENVRTIIAENLKQRRKEANLTQKQLSEKAGVSLGTLKRFEQTGEISLTFLLKIAVVLDCIAEFEGLFAKKQYQSIQEVIDEFNR